MIEKRTVLSQMEIQPGGSIGLRLEKQVVEGDRVLAREYHRSVLEPGGDADKQLAAIDEHLVAMGYAPTAGDVLERLKRIAAVEHTPEVVAAFAEARAAAKAAAEPDSSQREAGRASIAALVVVLSIALAGCASFTAWVGAHSTELAAVGLVAGTVSQVGGALVKVDEVAERAEGRLEKK